MVKTKEMKKVKVTGSRQSKLSLNADKYFNEALMKLVKVAQDHNKHQHTT